MRNIQKRLANGWYYNAEQRIQFCPAACDLVKNGGAFSIGLGCQASLLL